MEYALSQRTADAMALHLYFEANIPTVRLDSYTPRLSSVMSTDTASQQFYIALLKDTAPFHLAFSRRRA